MAPMVLEHARMLERRERLQQVLEIADGEMHSLYQQLSGNDHAVLLTDARGVILNCVNADAQRQTFEHAGLWLGADWSEALRRHQRHRHLRGRAAGPDHPAGRALP